jgi:Tfp pilus assembly protein PilX
MLHDESGMALLIALLLLLVMSAIAVSAIEHSGEESSVAGRFRRTAVTFHAADAGAQVALNRLSQTPPQTAAFSLNTSDGTTYRTGSKTDSSAQPISTVGVGPPPDGYCIGVGASCYVRQIYRTPVTASSTDGSVAELEVQFSRMEAGAGGY